MKISKGTKHYVPIYSWNHSNFVQDEYSINKFNGIFIYSGKLIKYGIIWPGQRKTITIKLFVDVSFIDGTFSTTTQSVKNLQRMTNIIKIPV